MKGHTRLLVVWNRLRSTYWFAPSLMTAAAVGLGLLAVYVDRHAREEASWAGWVYGGGADGARALLSTVAGATVTVVSLTFSITIVALTVASQHFGPRLLSNFMRDTAAQLVLGTFIGTFAFCLVVLRTVQGDGGAFDLFVPHLAVTLAVALALLCVAALIYYLHHVAASMQVSEITLSVARDLEAAIDRLYPAEGGEEPTPDTSIVPTAPEDAVSVLARGCGYVQAIDLDQVVALAQDHETVVWLEARPGHFVSEGTMLARISPPPARPEEFADGLCEACVLGADRTSWQDAGFAVQQLVEVALRALSPGMNEPFTAITCIDRLGQGLARLLGRPMPSPAKADSSHRVRVVTESKSFATLLDEAFEPIALYAGSNPAIYQRLLETMAALAPRAIRRADSTAIEERALAIRGMARQHLDEERHRLLIDRIHETVRAALHPGARPRPT